MTDRRRRLPAVNALVEDAERAGLTADAPRAVVVDAVRDVLADARRSGDALPDHAWLERVRHRVANAVTPSLVRVVNATGVVLHTNLGRAPLASAARRQVAEALGYSTLELDREAGARGSRQAHTRALLQRLTGAEDAIVVNNAASALLLTLAALADGAETIVSRGELVEIGGAFRIPDILARSGSVLVEVGTTNRTRLRDYALAVSPRTRLILKVHRSNFELRGFVAEAGLEELVALGRERGIPVVHDVGSGLLLSLAAWGLEGEPLVPDSIRAGATVIFSGDKLLGGPQAGIVAGPADILGALSSSPLARVLRPDKTTFASLEATLGLYRDPEIAVRDIPVLAMLTASPTTLKRRAARLARLIPGAGTAPGRSAVGGGSFPGVELPTTLVTVTAAACDTLLARLRAHVPPVIARAQDGGVVLDVRTIADDEFDIVASAVRGGSAAP